MQHHKSRRRKIFTFISGLVGEETLKVVSVHTLCSDVDVRDHIGFLSKCVCFLSSSSCIFRAPLRSHWLISCKRYILKVELWKAAWGEKVFFSFSFLLSVQFHWRPKGYTGWQVESPGMASVVLTNKSYQKVNKQQRLYEKWHKWKRSRIAGWHSVQDDFSFLLVSSPRASDSL